MRLLDIFRHDNATLLEVKARIEHPEDLVFSDGIRGAIQAQQILQATADRPEHVSVKLDGSPSLILGWRGDEFILTDKAGFSAKGYDGMTTSPEAIESMIMGRKMKDTSPEAVILRKSYAGKIAGLYNILKAAVPKTFEGYAQGDLMWTGTPPLVDGAYQFTPVKITYRVPADSELGKKIGASTVGMAIHSVFSGPEDPEPEPLRNVSELGFKETGGLVVLPHELQLEQTLKLDKGYQKQLKSVIQGNREAVDAFLDPLALADNDIKALPGVMKSFLAYKAGRGENVDPNVATEFLSYVQNPISKVSARMAPRIQKWIQDHLDGYNAVWRMVKLLVDQKLFLKHQIDQQVRGTVDASLRDRAGHEGFVSATPHGVVKLVDRPHFMKKDVVTEAAEGGARVVWTFLRANPPTQAHHMVVDQVVKNAHGDDYWIFLSHSQDPQKNPLDFGTKLHYARLGMRAHAHHFVTSEGGSAIRTPLLAADWLYNQGYRDLVLVVGSDRVDSMKSILTDWNSDAIRGKYGREECKITVLNAGERDPDAEGISGMSASKARAEAAADDFPGFHKIVGLDDASALSLFDAVKKGMIKTKKAKPVKEDTHHTHGTIMKLVMESDCARQMEDWCQRRAIVCMPGEDLHCTIMFSKKGTPHLSALDGKNVSLEAEPHTWSVLGEKALVLEFEHPLAQQLHDLCKRHGAEHSFPNFRAHTSVNYGWEHDSVPQELPDFPLRFDVVSVQPIDPNWGKN